MNAGGSVLGRAWGLGSERNPSNSAEFDPSAFRVH